LPPPPPRRPLDGGLPTAVVVAVVVAVVGWARDRRVANGDTPAMAALSAEPALDALGSMVGVWCRWRSMDGCKYKYNGGGDAMRDGTWVGMGEQE